MPFNVDFRPKSLDEFIGNRSTVSSLSSVLDSKNPPHTYLFTGPRGCGKTTLGRIAAETLGCTGTDLKELNSADYRKIEDARDLLRSIKLKPFESPVKGYLMDEAHQLTNAAQNSLLKALEEPPAHVYFFLCTTNPEKLLNTVVDRCSQYEVGPLTSKQSRELIDNVLKVEKEDLPEKVVEAIAKTSAGFPRKILINLEKVVGLPESQMIREIKSVEKTEQQAIDLCRALMQRKSWKAVVAILKGIESEEPEKIRRLMIEYCSKVILNSNPDPQAYVVYDCFREPFFNNGWPGLRFACYEALEAGE